jgi:hypothetical protein
MPDAVSGGNVLFLMTEQFVTTSVGHPAAWCRSRAPWGKLWIT